ncbi:MAG: biopolymer transporter ExbD [Myxococcales bacterium]|nr:biopolymer transporter ExbD [Myxococcales bacterium]MCB9565777.1 biopolymer transporter ExbD [Myxococcales bacterium]MCB9703036.1 biopolymer transporter ExbD [Myxococcales bacterium]
MARRKKEDGAGAVEANLLPVMNIMFLLIPALLMAMEFAQMAAIQVSTPQWSAGRESPSQPPKEELEVEVMIASDGITVKTAGVGVELREDPDDRGAIKRTGDGDDDYDFVALTAAARAIKAGYPETQKVIIKAESDVHLQTIVSALDALRGPECSMAKGEPSDACLLWQPVIRAT